MAYDEYLAERIRRSLKDQNTFYEEKKMFGGLCFLVDDKMCVGIVKEKLMLRLDPEIQDQALAREGCEPMDFTGKSMKGFVFVEPVAIDLDDQLDAWIGMALEYNPRAKSSKKKKGKS